MRFKDNRAASFAVIAGVYAMAAAVGVLCYRAFPFEPWLKLLLADVVATAVTYIFSVIFKNASVYDPYWSVQPIVITVAFAIDRQLNAVHILLLVAVCFWGVRLTANWAYTFKGLNHQDWRYTSIKQKTGRLYQPVNFLGIHLFPTLVVYACILPAVFAFVCPVQINVGTVIFTAVSLGAAVLQGVADIQMHKYRKNRNGNFIRNGLWKYSRHPNYLGEILMWWGVGLACVCAMPDKWYLLVGALVNNLMFLFVSVPLAEGRQGKKEGFEEYKKQTRMFLPIKKFKTK